MPLSAAFRGLLVGLSLASLVACAGSPKYSLEEMRSVYGRSDSMLVAAARKGNLEHVKSLAHYDPTEQELADGFLYVSKLGHTEIVMYLLNKNPKLINWVLDEDSALHLAVKGNHLETTKYLIKKLMLI